jgi:enoyl-CoA hydratase
VVVITGAGEKAFCRGNELEQAQTGKTVETALAKFKETGTGFNVASAIASIDRPVIAAINGDALGQGLELALSCDVRLAAQSARFGFPQVASGLMPRDGGTQWLPRIIGKGKALELILTGEIIDAEEALAIGLVSQVVPPPDLVATVEALAQKIARQAPIALRFIKEAVNKGLDLTLEQGLRLEADLYFLLHTTADRTEGIKAFLEKRRPQFKGR